MKSGDLKEAGFLKYYRTVRKWACKQNGLLDADLELLIYLNAVGRFNRNDFMNGAYAYTWDKHRWERLRKNGWIGVWRQRNHTTIKYTVYKTSFKCEHLVSRVYRVLAGEEDIPITKNCVYYNNRSYTDKVMNKAIDDMIKDEDR